MSSFDDLAPVLAPARLPDAPSVGFRQGVVESWDQLTAANTVRIGGTLFTNVPVLNTGEAMLLQAGDVVGILVTGSGGASTYAILGRLTIPNTPAAVTALSMVSDRMYTDLVDPDPPETSTSSTFGDLATVGPTCTGVRVSASGKMVVMLSTAITYGFTGSGSGGGLMGFAISGASSVSPTDRASATSFATLGSTSILLERQAAIITVTGLNPGLHTVTAKYRRINVDATFSGRHMTVFGL